MGNRSDADEPSLLEAWTMLGARLGMTVLEHDDRSILVEGQVQGRHVRVAIQGAAPRSEFWRFFAGVSSSGSRSRRDTWLTSVMVGRLGNPGVTGVVAGSFIHHFVGPPPPWPERALIGPTTWIQLLCDLAAAFDVA